MPVDIACYRCGKKGIKHTIEIRTEGVAAVAIFMSCTVCLPFIITGVNDKPKEGKK